MSFERVWAPLVPDSPLEILVACAFIFQPDDCGYLMLKLLSMMTMLVLDNDHLENENNRFFSSFFYQDISNNNLKMIFHDQLEQRKFQTFKYEIIELLKIAQKCLIC